jgi:hypothetical protein
VKFPKLSKEGYSIESYRIINPQLDNFVIKNIAKLVIMTHDINAFVQPNVNGVVAIYDASGFTFRHFMRTVSSSKNSMLFSKYGQEASCVNLIQVHYINCSEIVTKTIAFFKSFISKELQDKFFFHSSNYETLYDYIPKEYLPIEFGGNQGSLKDYQEDTLKKLHKYREFLMKDENFFILN